MESRNHFPALPRADMSADNLAFTTNHLDQSETALAQDEPSLAECLVRNSIAIAITVAVATSQTDHPDCLGPADAIPDHRNHLLFAPSPYGFDPFSPAYDDPFSFPVHAAPPPPHQLRFPRHISSLPEAGTEAGTCPAPDAPQSLTPEELGETDDTPGYDPAPDNKLLSFSPLVVKAAIVDEAGRRVELGMAAELNGMFFVTEDVVSGDMVSDSPGGPSPHALQLTCYRRNLWQCSAQVTLPRKVARVARVADGQSLPVPILELATAISATESIDGKATEVISVPWKNPTNLTVQLMGNNSVSDVAAAPPRIVLDPTSACAGKDADGEADYGGRVTLAVAWKRLQFKHATANNGRRKGMQQHYVVRVGLVGRTEAGDWLEIADVQSSPVVVRGRNPRNFVNRAATGERRAERKSIPCSVSHAAPVAKADVESLTHARLTASLSSPDRGITQLSAPHLIKEAAFSHDSNAASCSAGTPTPNKPVASSVPIALSLSDDERSPCIPRTTRQGNPEPVGRAGSLGNFSKVAAGHVSGAGEDEDCLYEYFPLSINDWTMPVDAVYRPHFVHHAAVSVKAKADQGRGRIKRYFAD